MYVLAEMSEALLCTQSVDDVSLDQLASKCKLVNFKEGEIIMSQGQVNSKACVCACRHVGMSTVADCSSMLQIIQIRARCRRLFFVCPERFYI
jgi:hypothetical protein